MKRSFLGMLTAGTVLLSPALAAAASSCAGLGDDFGVQLVAVGDGNATYKVQESGPKGTVSVEVVSGNAIVTCPNFGVLITVFDPSTELIIIVPVPDED